MGHIEQCSMPHIVCRPQFACPWFKVLLSNPNNFQIDSFRSSTCIREFFFISLFNWLIGVVVVFANGLEDLGSIPGCVIPKTFKMVLDTSLLNT